MQKQFTKDVHSVNGAVPLLIVQSSQATIPDIVGGNEHIFFGGHLFWPSLAAQIVEKIDRFVYRSELLLSLTGSQVLTRRVS